MLEPVGGQVAASMALDDVVDQFSEVGVARFHLRAHEKRPDTRRRARQAGPSGTVPLLVGRRHHAGEPADHGGAASE
ncbi:MAG: hypothetical protein WBF75_03755 [Pseudonocardiaceae bacterium]